MLRPRVDRPLRSCFVLSAVLVLGACAPVEGVRVPTDAMRVDVRLLAYPAPRASHLTIGFVTGPQNRRVDLESGAWVEVEHDGSTFVASRGAGPGLIDGVAYLVELPDVDVDDVVAFRLQRPVEVDSGDSELFVPPRPALNAPMGGEVYGYGDSVPVAWNVGLGDGVWMRAMPVACEDLEADEVALLALVFGQPVRVDDSGAAALPIGNPGATGYPTCTFEVQVGYVREFVDLAPEFLGQGDVEVVSLAAPVEVTVFGTP